MIDFYLQHGKNRSFARQHFQLAEQTLNRWIKQFNHNGNNGLEVRGKKQTYSPEFKLSVVQAVKQGNCSAESACLHFGIVNSGIIIQWLQALERQGINGLMPKPKGRPIIMNVTVIVVLRWNSEKPSTSIIRKSNV